MRSPLSRLALVLMLLLSGCAAPQYRAIVEQPGDLPVRAAVRDVPFYPQEAYYCGPASLAMTLTWAGIPVSQDEIAEQVYTPGREGTLTTDILSGARRNGALAVEVANLQDLLGELAAGHPVLVFQNLGLNIFPRWHFAVATGYDLTAGNVILHSGLDADQAMNLNTFERTWKRADAWAVTVTPPDRLPKYAGEMAVLSAAAGLERAQRFDAAATAYTAIAERWPENLIARVGLGNALYAGANYTQAVDAYRQAIAINPSLAAAWNNLAHALARQGQHSNAIEAAKKAVALNSANETYQNTLKEITEGRVSTSE